jgi:hypothetical protein
MAQAKITVNDTQAKALGLLVYRKKYNPKTCIMFEPKSGINFRLTGPGDYIEVLDSADISNLKNFFKEGYFDVIEGKIADVTTFKSITLGANGLLSIHFDQPVYTAGLLAEDLVVTVGGTPVADITLGEVLAEDAAKILTVDIGEAPTSGATISFELKASGAAKILDTGDVAVVPATKTCIA